MKEVEEKGRRGLGRWRRKESKEEGRRRRGWTRGCTPADLQSRGAYERERER